MLLPLHVLLLLSGLGALVHTSPPERGEGGWVKSARFEGSRSKVATCDKQYMDRSSTNGTSGSPKDDTYTQSRYGSMVVIMVPTYPLHNHNDHSNNYDSS